LFSSADFLFPEVNCRKTKNRITITTTTAIFDTKTPVNEIVNFLVPAFYRTLKVFPAKFGKVREELRTITGSPMMPLRRVLANQLLVASKNRVPVFRLLPCSIRCTH
jgi:hypothetical protein